MRLGWLVVSGLLLATGVGSQNAFAKKAKAAKVEKDRPIDTRAITELMGDFKFGMTQQEVLGQLAKAIDKQYADALKNTEDVYKQDQLRRKKKEDLQRIKDSMVEFQGKKTGWDVSIIDDQFAHNTGESMMVYWENQAGSGKDQRRFFFFHEGKLFKMFIALNSGMLKGEQRNFMYFKDIMEKRYGAGKLVTVKDEKGEEKPVYLEWKSSDFHVQAIDKLDFYGSFCLMIAEPNLENQVAGVRDGNKKPVQNSSVLDSMVDKNSKPGVDDNSGVVEDILKGK